MHELMIFPSISYETILLDQKLPSRTNSSSQDNNSYTHIDAMLERMLLAVDKFDTLQDNHMNSLTLEPSSDALIEIPIKKLKSKNRYTTTANIFVEEEEKSSDSHYTEKLSASEDTSRILDNEFPSDEYLEYKDEMCFGEHSIDHELSENFYEPIAPQLSSSSNAMDYVWWEGTYRNLSIVVEEDEDNYSWIDNKTKMSGSQRDKIIHRNLSPSNPSTDENTDHESESSRILSSASTDVSDPENCDHMIKAEVKLMITSQEDGLDSFEVKSVKEFVLKNEKKKEVMKNDSPKKKRYFKKKLMNFLDKPKSDSEVVKLSTHENYENKTIIRPSFTFPRIFVKNTNSECKTSKLHDIKRSKSDFFVKPNDNYPLAMNHESYSKISPKMNLYANRPFYPIYGDNFKVRTKEPSNRIFYVPPSEVSISEGYCNWSSESDQDIGKV